MRLDHLARPFRIEQVGKALRRVLLLHQVGVVAERGDQHARRDVEPVRIVVVLVVILGDLLRQVGLRASPCCFQTMQCDWSAVLTTSTAWMLLSYSWPMRVKTRSAPERSTRTEMPGNFCSNVLPKRSASCRSMAV